MTNHVHLLCTPRKPKAISLLMQSLGRRYVQYFNYTYKRTGTLWEGRFKSCLIQEESYLLQVYKYIELNPVRAFMVEEPSNYIWSSYQVNALGKQSSLCTPHPVYSNLGVDSLNRQNNYRKLFNHHIDGTLIDDIRLSLNKGLALGNEHFKTEIEALCGRRVVEGRRGRPVGWRKKNRTK
jgi:putative transposase